MLCLGPCQTARLHFLNFSHKFGDVIVIGHKELHEYPGEKISPTNLASFPAFLRFNKVGLIHGVPWNTNSIEAMCELTEKHLLPIKPALKDTKMITFNGGISLHCGGCFRNHSKLLEFLRNRLLPICDSSHCYNFSIDLDSDKHAASNIIASILQIQQISRCSHSKFCFESVNQPINLPVEIVSNWLHRTFDENGNTKQKQERFLLIYSNAGTENLLQIWDSLKRVDFYVIRLKINIKFRHLAKPKVLRCHLLLSLTVMLAL